MRMNRRKVLMGLGSLATLAGGAIGTGAFSQVSAPRDAQISVASDSEAYLSIDATDSQSDMVGQREENGTIAFDFGGGSVNSSANPTGAGLNPQSVTTVPDAFTVYNHGTETIQVKAKIPSDGFGADVSESDKLAVKRAVSLTYTPDAASDPAGDLLWDESEGAKEWIEFAVGEGGWVELEFDLRDTGLTGDLVNQITFVATTDTTSQ